MDLDFVHVGTDRREWNTWRCDVCGWLVTDPDDHEQRHLDGLQLRFWPR